MTNVKSFSVAVKIKLKKKTNKEEAVLHYLKVVFVSCTPLFSFLLSRFCVYSSAPARTSVPPPTQTHCHHICSPKAPTLTGTDLSALPARSSPFKEFQTETLSLRRTHAHTHWHKRTMSSSSSCIYLFFPSSCYLWEIKSISQGMGPVGTSNGAAQAKSAQTGRAGKGTFITVTHTNIIATRRAVSPTLPSTSLVPFRLGLPSQDLYRVSSAFFFFSSGRIFCSDAS